MTAVEKYCSIVSLLLIAGTGLILAEGPIGHGILSSFHMTEVKPASVCVIYTIDANGRGEIMKKTSSTSGLKSVVNADSSARTTDGN